MSDDNPTFTNSNDSSNQRNQQRQLQQQNLHHQFMNPINQMSLLTSFPHLTTATQTTSVGLRQNRTISAAGMRMIGYANRNIYQQNFESEMQRLQEGGPQDISSMTTQRLPNVSLYQPGSVRPDRISSARPQFRTKIVCRLDCKYCGNMVCSRGMKAILLADMAVELFSTDVPPETIALVNEDYQTNNCFCRIRDVACRGCGNTIGYHVTQPCQPCMDACNNGHFWMFHVDHVKSIDRMNSTGNKPLLWANLPRNDKDTKIDVYNETCR